MARDRVSRTLFMFLRRRLDVMLVAYAFCLARTASAISAAARDNTKGSKASTVDDLNRSLDRLSSKVETLTHQVEDFIEAAGQQREGRGTIVQLPSRIEVERADQWEEGEDTEELDILQNNVDEKQQRRQREDEEGGEKEDEQEQKEDRGASDGGSWGWGRDGRRFGPPWLAVATFVHEVWLLLQHANILLNPLCQRLDRSYGVALLRRRLYWVIAGVLAAYWAREIISMLIASPYASPLTLKMVVISSVYHVGKILLISLDAKRQWSPTLGIMRLLMDHWHMSSLKDTLLCIKRMSLQAFDTVTHALIVRDMVRWDEESAERKLDLYKTFVVVSLVWVIHAIANLVTRISTATLVVELAKSVVRKCGVAAGEHHSRPRSSYGVGKRAEGTFGALDGGRAEHACTASCSHRHKRCEVCHLLTRDKPTASAAAPPPQWKRVD